MRTISTGANRSTVRAAGRHPQRGVALFVGLVFLVILSLVAVYAMKGTLLEMHMVNNVASHERAFEASESMRAIPVALFDQHVFNRGWPADSDAKGYKFYNGGGGLPPDDFSFGMEPAIMKKAGVGLRKSGATPVKFYEILCRSDLGEDANTCQYHPESWIHPDQQWNGADMHIAMCADGSGSSCTGPNADIYIRPDGTVLTEGSGGAQVTGYRGPGTSSAGGGGSSFFEIMSVGHSGSGRAVTLAQYRQAIRN